MENQQYRELNSERKTSTEGIRKGTFYIRERMSEKAY